MLSPKDKAIELYCKYIDAYNDRNLQVSDYKFAKQCALIAIDEMINVCYWNITKEFLLEVKKELEAL